MTSDWRADMARLERAALIDTAKAKAVRVADYFDGGGDNFQADRKAARALVAVAPVIAMIAPAWRGFTRRVLRYLIREACVRQFLFVGMTLAASNAHEVVWSEDQDCRIVFADDDPLVLAHARAHMRPGGAGRRDGGAQPCPVGYVPAGLRDPGAIIAGARSTLDFGQPIAVILFFVLAFIDETAAAAHVVSALTEATPSGSHVALHHLAGDVDPALAIAARRWNRQSPQQITLRSRAAVESLVAGLEPVPPGLVLIEDWRPSSDSPRSGSVIPLYGVVARKPLAPPPLGRRGQAEMVARDADQDRGPGPVGTPGLQFFQRAPRFHGREPRRVERAVEGRTGNVVQPFHPNRAEAVTLRPPRSRSAETVVTEDPSRATLIDKEEYQAR